MAEPLSFVPLFMSALGLVGTTYASVSGHPKSAYYSQVKEIQDDRWNSVCNELGPIIADVYEFVNTNDNDHDAGDLSKGDVAALHLRRVLDGRGDLNNLEGALSKLDEPADAYRVCRYRWSRSVKLYIASILLGIIATGLLYVSESFWAIASGIIIATISSVAVGLAIRDFYLHLEKKDELDEMAEDVDFM